MPPNTNVQIVRRGFIWLLSCATDIIKTETIPSIVSKQSRAPPKHIFVVQHRLVSSHYYRPTTGRTTVKREKLVEELKPAKIFDGFPLATELVAYYGR